ncbi:MAG: 6-phosphogluconolactonase, partial [Candidatus Omnitrophica bacterium]|nr:6-phosphogluconolactonase [Candidatus Omnitrophota bacterium]
MYLNREEINKYIKDIGENLICYLEEYIEKFKKDIEEKTTCITDIYEYLYRINNDIEGVSFVYRIALLEGFSIFDAFRREVYRIAHLKLVEFKEDIEREVENIFRLEGLNLLPLLALKNTLEISGFDYSDYISKVVNKLEAFKQQIDKDKRLFRIEEVTSEVYDFLSSKAAKLGDLMLLLKDSDFKVPEGFIFTSKCYREFIDKYRFDNTSINEKIKEILSSKEKNLKEIVEEIKALFIHPLAKELFKDLFSKEIEGVWGLLGEDVPKIVRSAALNTEDQRDRSFAGMYESISWVFSRERLIEAILNVWASLFNDKVIEYLNYNVGNINNIEDYVENASMDVIIQKMINSSKSAVIFSIDITQNDLLSILICAGWGLGEGIERYSQDTDRITYDKRTGKIKTVIGYKNKKVIGNIDSKLKEFVEVEDNMKNKEVFNNEEIEDIVRITELIEQYYCYPVNIEIAIEGDKKYCIQVRDITDLHIEEGKKIYQEMREKFSVVDKDDLTSVLGSIFENNDINWLMRVLFIGSIPIHELGHLVLSKLQRIDVEFRFKDLFKGRIGVCRAPPLVRLAGILANLVIGALSLFVFLQFSLPFYISLPLSYIFITNIIQFVLELTLSLILKKGDFFEAILDPKYKSSIADDHSEKNGNVSSYEQCFDNKLLFRVEELIGRINISNTEKEMGEVAANNIIDNIEECIKNKGKVIILWASAPSQHSTWQALIPLFKERKIDPNKIICFHMDEYVGLEKDAPQLFGKVLREKLFSKLGIPEKDIFYFHSQIGYDTAKELREKMLDSNVSKEEISRLREELEKEVNEHISQIDNKFKELGSVFDIVVGGIGVHPHLAFNDWPEAKFDDPRNIKVVTLSETSRIQQVEDREFKNIDDVPTHAITFTLPPILNAEKIHIIVPRLFKAEAVKKTLEEDISERIPASGLRLPHILPKVYFYFDKESSSKSEVAQMVNERMKEIRNELAKFLLTISAIEFIRTKLIGFSIYSQPIWEVWKNIEKRVINFEDLFRILSKLFSISISLSGGKIIEFYLPTFFSKEGIIFWDNNTKELKEKREYLDNLLIALLDLMIEKAKNLEGV